MEKTSRAPVLTPCHWVQDTHNAVVVRANFTADVFDPRRLFGWQSCTPVRAEGAECRYRE